MIQKEIIRERIQSLLADLDGELNLTHGTSVSSGGLENSQLSTDLSDVSLTSNELHADTSLHSAPITGYYSVRN